jgi:hypothetical protein
MSRIIVCSAERQINEYNGSYYYHPVLTFYVDKRFKGINKITEEEYITKDGALKRAREHGEQERKKLFAKSIPNIGKINIVEKLDDTDFYFKPDRSLINQKTRKKSSKIIRRGTANGYRNFKVSDLKVKEHSAI